MTKKYTISVFTENNVGLLNRVTIIFTRRHINIDSLTASESELKGIYRYTIVVHLTEEQVQKVVGQIEKQVEIIKAFYHEEKDIISQEVALYKVPTNLITAGTHGESVLRKHNARVLSVEQKFSVVEKTGSKEETEELFHDLEPLGILEFARSGRVAITKPMKEFKDTSKK